MRYKKSLIDKLIRLASGETVASSSFTVSMADEMLADGIITRQSRGQSVSYRAVDTNAFTEYLANHYGITSLYETAEMLSNDSMPRYEQVHLWGDSKAKHQRTMKGFLVNSYTDIQATLKGQSITIHPEEGSFTYIYDYEDFYIDNDVVVIGMENCENFRMVERQAYLFQDFDRPLFVCRYPQNGDLVRWLGQITNRYIHFGDFDLAGISIFQNEFYAHLGPSRSEFFVPDDIEARLPFGSRERYDVQYAHFGNMPIEDSRLRKLVRLIHQHHRGYDQEGYIAGGPVKK